MAGVGMNEKTDVHIVWRAQGYCMAGGAGVGLRPPYNVHVGFFIHTSTKRKKSTFNS